MRLAVLCAVAVIVGAGCGRGDTGRVPVRGTVIYEGKPVAWGSIALRPTRDAKGPAAGTDIVDGKYEIPASAGPATGLYTARITIVQRDDTTSGPIVKGPGSVKSLEVPVAIETDREQYDFELPDAAEELNRRKQR